jgi:hypothetical protein
MLAPGMGEGSLVEAVNSVGLSIRHASAPCSVHRRNAIEFSEHQCRTGFLRRLRDDLLYEKLELSVGCLEKRI